MTGGTTPEFPTDIRKMIEQSVEQVRTVVTSYLEFLQRVSPGDVTGGSELSNKVLYLAESNLASAFEFAGKLAQVKDFQALASLQMEFIQAMTEQAKELSEAMTKAMMDTLKTPTKGGPLS
jgi:hypothetical protein